MDTLMPALDWLSTDAVWFTLAFAMLAVVGWTFYQHTWLRRKDAQAFAAQHGMRFEGNVAPDGRPPYIQIDHLKWSVLVHNAVEGSWEGLDVAVFEMNVSKHTTRTAAIVRARDLLGDVTPAAAGRFAKVTTFVDLLYVQSNKRLPASALAGFLSDAVALARRLSDDAGGVSTPGRP